MLVPASALAFHAGDVFDKPPGAGGGGGIFYAGIPAERGWTCAACHAEAPGTIGVELDSDPRALFDTGSYEPGQAYTITAKLLGEHEGLTSPQSNFNSLVLTIIDGSGQPAGSIAGYAAEEFYASGPTTIASAGQQVGETSWTITWHAPAPSVGPVSIHLAAVDGNGANSGPNGTLTDPWGDDVFIGTLSLDAPPAVSQQGFGLGALAAMFPWVLRRARRRWKETP
jgi:hypothetical protein